jgi:chorismate synthase
LFFFFISNWLFSFINYKTFELSTKIVHLFKTIDNGNSYGTLYKITTFGESHGEALGGIIDGCPSGITLDLEAMKLKCREGKPGQSVVTNVKEPDAVQFFIWYI